MQVWLISQRFEEEEEKVKHIMRLKSCWKYSFKTIVDSNIASSDAREIDQTCGAKSPFVWTDAKDKSRIFGSVSNAKEVKPEGSEAEVELSCEVRGKGDEFIFSANSKPWSFTTAANQSAFFFGSASAAYQPTPCGANQTGEGFLTRNEQYPVEKCEEEYPCGAIQLGNSTEPQPVRDGGDP